MILKTFEGERNARSRQGNRCHGWTQSVYKFGCAFIHLSQFHDYLSVDPFSKIEANESDAIKHYLNQYHRFPLDAGLSIAMLRPYLVNVFDKISGNLAYYLDNLENGENKEFD